MTPNELLIPRYQCIGVGIHHYPKSPFMNGDVLIQFKHNIYGTCLAISEDAPVSEWQHLELVEQYPNLFRKMKWWEDRCLDDILDVGYLKYMSMTTKKYKFHVVKKWQYKKVFEYSKIGLVANDYIELNDGLFEPATQEEYDNYLKSAQ